MSSNKASSSSTSALARLSMDHVTTQYTMGSLLKEKTIYKIYSGTHRETGELVSILALTRKPVKGKQQALANEIQVLRKINHPNIIRLIHVFDHPKQMHLVMELAKGGELLDRMTKVGKFNEKDAIGIVYQVLDAVAYLHDAGIVHRNLEPENVLYKTRDDDSKIMLCNFGLSITNDLEGVASKTPCGSLIYTAPEILRKQPYGKASDVWSIGIITHTLLCGYPPFAERNAKVLSKQIKKAEFEFASPDWDKISDAAKVFIIKLLDKDPEKRYACRQAMEDPWICGEAAGTSNIQET